MFGLLRKKERVLLLDDDPAIQRLVSALLRRSGLRVQVVGKGNEAIAAIRKDNDFGAILLDLMMPHEGGMTVIAHLREHDPEQLKRVIVLTATPGSVLKSLAREVAAIVHKPFTPDDLVQTVNRVVASG